MRNYFCYIPENESEVDILGYTPPIVAVDNQNVMRNYGRTNHQVVLENVWINHRWAIKVFKIYSMHKGKLLFVSHLCSKYGLENKGFRFILANKIIHNE